MITFGELTVLSGIFNCFYGVDGFGGGEVWGVGEGASGLSLGAAHEILRHLCAFPPCLLEFLGNYFSSSSGNHGASRVLFSYRSVWPDSFRVL